jgi:hypothetical protein
MDANARRDMGAWVVLTFLVSGNLSAGQPVFKHVRSDEADVRRTVGEGYSRSASFRRLVDAVEQTPCIVYVETTVKLSRGMTGALLHVATGRRDLPILRVLLKTNLSTEEAIATIGHELQHVVEAMMGPAGPSGVDFEVFDRLDPTAAKTSGSRKYETDAAVEVTRRIRDELQRSRRRSHA